MNNFIPPTKGTKIAELNISILQYQYYYLQIMFRTVMVFGIPSFFIYFYLNNDNLTFWFWVVAIPVGFIALSYIFMDKPKDLTGEGRKFSLFLAKDGVEINDIFIPFKNEYTSPKKGIVSFKLDGEFLILKTEGKEYLVIGWGYITENKFKFKIEPKYHSNKEELLDFLNSLV